jgi:hypothetical protein
MRITILQPTYLPWLGYFEMIARTDAYVCFDHVQFEPKSWQQRNRIKAPNGVIMLTVPVKSDGRQDVRIRDKRIDYNQTWARNHARSVEVAYRKAPGFGRYFARFAEIVGAHYPSIADLNLTLIRYFLDCLGLSPRVIRSSELDLGDESGLSKTDRVVNVCRKVGATHLYDGAAAGDFLELPRFAEHGIEVRFQSYVHPAYPQQFGAFAPFMSVLDLLMNCGDDALPILLGERPARQESGACS